MAKRISSPWRGQGHGLKELMDDEPMTIAA